jgi:hypothetical protein
VLVAETGSGIVLRHGAVNPAGRGDAVVMRARMGAEGGAQGRQDEEQRDQKCRHPLDAYRHAASRWFRVRPEGSQSTPAVRKGKSPGTTGPPWGYLYRRRMYDA